jgi:hypothetical protein
MAEKIPAWVVAKVDQRLALMADMLSRFGNPAPALAEYGLMMTPLSEPDEGATPDEYKIWDRSCDNCGRYCPGDFFTGSVTRTKWGTQIVFTFGTCPECKELP